MLYTDNAYPDYALDDLVAKATGSQQATARKQHSRRLPTPAQQLLRPYFCKRVATFFSQLTARFPGHLHAATAAGLMLKLALFVFVHTADQAGC